MRRVLVIISLAAGTGVLVGAAESGDNDHARFAEVTRLQRHFDSVDIELKSVNVLNLTPGQHTRRALLTAWLGDYRNAASFPKNDRFDAPAPFFRDSEGTLCAMAYLIDRSGRGDIVNKVAATRNNAYIAELADDPALIAWLDSAGLSVAEAARIQPAYNGFPIGEDRGARVESDKALVALALGSVSLATSAINILKPSHISGFLGILAGGVAIGTGVNFRGENSGTDRVAAATIALGAVSLGAGVYGLLEARHDDDDDDEDDHNRNRDRPRGRGRGRSRISMTFAPDVVVGRNEPRIGVVFAGRF